MGERLKTVVLVFLVITSIILTGQLLFRLPALETAVPPAYEQLVFGELRPVTEHLKPALHFNTGNELRMLQPWDKGYDTAWEVLNKLLLLNGVPEAFQPLEEENNQFLKDRDAAQVKLHFSVSSPVSLWNSSFRLHELIVDSLYWNKAEPGLVWLRDGERWLRSELHALPQDFLENISIVFSEAPKHIVTEAKDWEPLRVLPGKMLILPDAPLLLAPRRIKKEELNTDKLLRSIFVDTALVRRIEERDGAFIYTDGQKGLRFYDHGELEYTSPKSEPGFEEMELASVMRRSAQYLQLLGGWPEHIYLDDVIAAEKSVWNRQQRDTYYVTFVSVQEGMPLIGARAPITLHFSDRGVVYYNRQINLLGEETASPATMINPRLITHEVMNKSEQEGFKASLIDIYAGYYLKESIVSQAVAHPVWAMVFDDGRTAVINGFTGKFLVWIE